MKWPCKHGYLCGPTADFADSAVGVDADVVDAEGAVGVDAILGALACRAGGLERGDEGELREPVPQVLQSSQSLTDLVINHEAPL